MCGLAIVCQFEVRRQSSFISEPDPSPHGLPETDTTKVDRCLVCYDEALFSEATERDGEVASLRGHLNAPCDVFINLHGQYVCVCVCLDIHTPRYKQLGGL